MTSEPCQASQASSRIWKLLPGVLAGVTGLGDGDKFQKWPNSGVQGGGPAGGGAGHGGGAMYGGGPDKGCGHVEGGAKHSAGSPTEAGPPFSE